MQTTDAATLLQILQSPAGTALIPMLADRERLVQDQSQAATGESLQRTLSNYDENRRANERQPLTLADLTSQTESRRASTVAQNHLNAVNEGYGVPNTIRDKEQAARVRDMQILKTGAEMFPSIAASVEAAGVAPGAARATAIEQLKRAGQPQSLIDAIQNEKDESQIAPRLKAMAESAAKLTRQFIQQDATNTSRENIADRRALTDIQIAKIKAEAQEIVARIRASGSKGNKPPKEVMQNLYTDARRKEIMAGSEEERLKWKMVAEGVLSDMQSLPAGAGTLRTTIVPGTDGRPTLGQVPGNQSRPAAAVTPPVTPATPAAGTGSSTGQSGKSTLTPEEYLNLHTTKK